MTIGSIRDKMQFKEEYSVPSKGIELRLYTTKRSGMYGYQWAAILWTANGDGYAGERTTGCGYSKDAHAAMTAFHAAGIPYGHEILRLAESGRIEKALGLFAGCDEIHHAHG